MDIHQLEILDRLVAFGSLKKAASECYVSTSTLSRQIDAMENEVGFRIFTRSPYGISLTDQGQIFYDQTRSIPLLYESAVSNARTSQPDRQIIKVGVFSYDRRQITKLCEMIEKDVHSIDFSFISCRVSDMHATLLNRKVDLSLLTVLENEDDRFFSLPLFKASNAVIVSSVF